MKSRVFGSFFALPKILPKNIIFINPKISRSKLHTFFLYKNTVYKNTEAEIWYHIFQKMEKYSSITKESFVKWNSKSREAV